ncbi:putative Protein kinase domain containing protein [Blattamonas nauphoetae]|uniref:Protein kinase domain-containing protein n=1 Tax=Blattamonas nauphoetae TaxID=2049346 RepID=A0ABQ9YD83_9EUKA|nr:putative Protein kinase domain containing protein [Blattamonas nauphoetae]
MGDITADIEALSTYEFLTPRLLTASKSHETNNRVEEPTGRFFEVSLRNGAKGVVKIFPTHNSGSNSEATMLNLIHLKLNTLHNQFIIHPQPVPPLPEVQQTIFYFDCADFDNSGSTITLATVLSQSRKRPLPEDVSKRLIFMIISGVCGLHSMGIMHRNIKPSNFLFITSADRQAVRLVVADFTIATQISPQGLTQSEDIFKRGSLPYQPYEIHIRESYNESIDVWAVGCIIYELLTGNQAFPQKSSLSLQQAVKQGKLFPESHQKRFGHLCHRDPAERLRPPLSSLLKDPYFSPITENPLLTTEEFHTLLYGPPVVQNQVIEPQQPVVSHTFYPNILKSPPQPQPSNTESEYASNNNQPSRPHFDPNADLADRVVSDEDFRNNQQQQQLLQEQQLLQQQQLFQQQQINANQASPSPPPDPNKPIVVASAPPNPMGTTHRFGRQHKKADDDFKIACSHCGMAVRSSDMEEHVRTKHPQQPEEPKAQIVEAKPPKKERRRREPAELQQVPTQIDAPARPPSNVNENEERQQPFVDDSSQPQTSPPCDSQEEPEPTMSEVTPNACCCVLF